MTDQNLSIEELFNSAVNIVRNLPKEGPIKPSDELKLKFYAHFKQATHGPNDTPKPKFYQLVESYKWDAWKKLGDMSKEDAKNNYIRQLKEVIDEIPSGEELGDIGEFRKILGDRSFDCWFGHWGSKAKLNFNNINNINNININNNKQKQSINVSNVVNCDPALRSTRYEANGTTTNNNPELEESHSENSDDGYETPRGSVPSSLAREFSDEIGAAIYRLASNLRH